MNNLAIELKGKRLLLLGGRLWMKAISDFCRENGIVIVTAGNIPSSKINRIADEYYNIDSTDSTAMKKLIKEKHIDGVYLGGSEPVITAAVAYVNDLGLPCYCNQWQWECLQNKSKFKQLCLENGLPVAPRFDYETLLRQESVKEFPVVIKPVDGSGSKGFSVCKNKEALKKGYMYAVEASFTGEVLIEKFLHNESIVVFYTLSNGNVIFSGIEDKYPVRYKEQGSYVAGLHLFESDLAECFRTLYEEKLKNFFKAIGVSEGSLWIEVFYDSGQFYFNEVGYRYSGSVSVYPVDYFYGINQVAADIYYALTGKSRVHGFLPLCKTNIERKKKYAIYSIHIRHGIIGEEIGFDEIERLNNVVAIPTTKNIGDEVQSSGTVDQVYAFVHFTFDDDNELRRMLAKIQRTLKVYDSHGVDMINHMINPDSLVIR